MFILTLVTNQDEDVREFTELSKAISCAQSFIGDETIQNIVLEGGWDNYHLKGVIEDKKIAWKSVHHS